MNMPSSVAGIRGPAKNAILALIATMACLCLSGCIEVSPYHEIVDCAVRFMDAASESDLDAITELTCERPDGWEQAIQGTAFLWSSGAIADVKRSGDRARVWIQFETRTEEEDEEIDSADLDGPDGREWVMELVRIEGVWLVHLASTLAPE